MSAKSQVVIMFGRLAWASAKRCCASEISPGDKSMPLTYLISASIHFQMSPPRPQAKSRRLSAPLANLYGVRRAEFDRPYKTGFFWCCILRDHHQV